MTHVPNGQENGIWTVKGLFTTATIQHHEACALRQPNHMINKGLSWILPKVALDKGSQAANQSITTFIHHYNNTYVEHFVSIYIQ